MNRHSPLRLRIYGRASQADSAECGPAGEPLRIGLEEALSNLERLPRMFVELDGSFLWTGQSADSGASGSGASGSGASGSEPRHWQLEGTIYDDGRVVRYVDLRGNCPLSAWKTFLAALDATPATVTLQLIEDDLIVPGQWLEQQLATED